MASLMPGTKVQLGSLSPVSTSCQLKRAIEKQREAISSASTMEWVLEDMRDRPHVSRAVPGDCPRRETGGGSAII